MAIDDMDRVVPLGQLDDFRVAHGEPDVRGWEVRASDGRKIGEVDELLVDTRAMKVRYLDVEVTESMLADRPDRHVLIPIGYARLERDCVVVDRVASSELGGIPSYGQGPLTRDFETSLRDSFSARGTGTRGIAGSAGMGGGALSGEGGMLDTAGLDNTPGIGTGMGMTGLRGGVTADGGMRGGASELDTASSVHSPGSSAGMMAAGDDGLGGARMSAGGQGPRGGLEREMARGAPHSREFGVPTREDAAHRAGNAGADYIHPGDDDFYATDAFDDARFYGRGLARPAEESPNHARGGSLGLSQGTGMDGVDVLRGSGLPRDGGEDPGGSVGTGDAGADREETSRLAREGMDRLREDHRNRGVGGGGSP